MRINFNEPLAELQRQLSSIIAATESVRLALESLEKLRFGLYHDDTDGTLSGKVAAREAAEQRHWTMQSEAWRTHRNQNEAFKNLLLQMATIRARKKAYVARMRKACSADRHARAQPRTDPLGGGLHAHRSLLDPLVIDEHFPD
jgi:hypothetical protein